MTSRNGFQTFDLHTQDESALITVNSLRAEGNAFRGINAVDGDDDLSKLDPETAARQYLQTALNSQALPQFAAPQIKGKPCEFRILGTENQPLTNTTTVKFRQTFHKIPVYGSLVTVELDERNDLMALNSSLAEPETLKTVAKISQQQAIDKVRELASYGANPLDATPRLIYYYDEKTSAWRLVYLIEDVWQYKQDDNDKEHIHSPLLMDYFIDSQTGEAVAERPRTPSMASFADNGIDELGEERVIFCDQLDDGQFELVDIRFNVRTFDFGFQDIRSGILPGNVFQNPPIWDASAISAHANAVEVASFLQQVLQRKGIDNIGSPLVSSVNCVDLRRSPDGRQWKNAAWLPSRKQMVYGQRLFEGRLRSYAAGLDVVAHEIFHGITDHTSRLEYANETGAMNESYSDIFGILVSNRNEPNINNWNWDMGEDVDGSGVPIRNFRNPGALGQPMHMHDFVNTLDDSGGVHGNSGIHNFAAFNIMTAKDQQNNFLFDLSSLSALFYLALTQFLTRTSLFSDSRRALILVARTLFRNDLPSLKNAKIQAIANGFDAVGVL